MNGTTLAGLILPGLATTIGGLGVLAFPHPGERVIAGLLGFTAGIMLAASVFSLLVPALELGSLGEVLLGFGLGAVAIGILDVAIPHAHARFAERRRAPAGSRALLLLGALTIHNIPEGLAVGVAFAAGGADLGLPVAIAIGPQNVPEGFAAASPLLDAGVSRAAAMVYVVVDELVPESHSRGHERVATTGLVGGFAVMMVLDNAFG